MLEGGEDPRFIVRRMVILASEDIGNADPAALSVATAAAAGGRARRPARGPLRARAGGHLPVAGAEVRRGRPRARCRARRTCASTAPRPCRRGCALGHDLARSAAAMRTPTREPGHLGAAGADARERGRRALLRPRRGRGARSPSASREIDAGHARARGSDNRSGDERAPMQTPGRDERARWRATPPPARCSARPSDRARGASSGVVDAVAKVQPLWALLRVQDRGALHAPHGAGGDRRLRRAAASRSPASRAARAPRSAALELLAAIDALDLDRRGRRRGARRPPRAQSSRSLCARQAGAHRVRAVSA